jgi:hypothetical protein
MARPNNQTIILDLLIAQPHQQGITVPTMASITGLTEGNIRKILSRLRQRHLVHSLPTSQTIKGSAPKLWLPGPCDEIKTAQLVQSISQTLYQYNLRMGRVPEARDGEIFINRCTALLQELAILWPAV